MTKNRSANIYLQKSPKSSRFHRHLSCALLIPAVLLAQGSIVLFPPTLNSRAVDRLPLIDGEIDEMWQYSKPVEIIAVGNTLPDVEVPLVVRSLHTKDEVAFLIEWPDATRHDSYHRQIWGRDILGDEAPDAPDDQLALRFNISGSRLSCMLAGKDMIDDIWHWKAARTDPSGFAQDRMMVVERIDKNKKPTEPNEYSGRNGSPVRVLWVEDEGTQLLRQLEPEEIDGVGQSFWLSTPDGSQADIRAHGMWRDGVWTLEISRALDTRHDDDAKINPKGTTKFSIAVFDSSEGQVHSNTRFLKLKIER